MPELSLLMQQVAKGSETAFHQLAQNLANKMLAVAYKLLNGNQALAEELVQESLTKLWQAAPTWRNTGSVAAFACQIVRNNCYDYHRKKQVNITPLHDNISLPEKTVQQLEQQQQEQWLSVQIAGLPERQQQALTLVYFHEQQYKEAAKSMGISLKSLERLVERGRDALKEQAQNHLHIAKGGYLS